MRHARRGKKTAKTKKKNRVSLLVTNRNRRHKVTKYVLKKKHSEKSIEISVLNFRFCNRCIRSFREKFKIQHYNWKFFLIFRVFRPLKQYRQTNFPRNLSGPSFFFYMPGRGFIQIRIIFLILYVSIVQSIPSVFMLRGSSEERVEIKTGKTTQKKKKQRNVLGGS